MMSTRSSLAWSLGTLSRESRTYMGRLLPLHEGLSASDLALLGVVTESIVAKPPPIPTMVQRRDLSLGENRPEHVPSCRRGRCVRTEPFCHGPGLMS